VVIIRGTQKLLRRLGPATGGGCESTTQLGDWLGNLYGVGHKRVVLLISQHSRLPVVLPDRNLKDIRHQLPLAVGAVLEALGIPRHAIRDELDSMADAVVAPTNSRSLVATLTDLSYSLKWRLAEEPDVNLVTLALWLSVTPIGPMNYRAPDKVTRELFG
jgi:hypothetical protein